MTEIPTVEIIVMPYHCDSNGHVNQAAYLSMFERARWESLRSGPGMDLFSKLGTWVAVRKVTAEYHAIAGPGDVLRIDTNLTHHGRTSFSLHQAARRDHDRVLVAEAEFVFVCVGGNGKPVEVPAEIATFFGGRPSVQGNAIQRQSVRDVALAVDVRGDGPAVLWIHGFPLDRTVWQGLLASLERWRCIAPDLRGMGLSTLGEAEPSISVYADDMVALLDELHVEQAVVGGLSMGGYVALDLMRRHTGRVRGLILANTRATADDTAARAARDETIQMIESDGTSALADSMIPKLVAPQTGKAKPQVVEHLRTMITNSSVPGLIAALRAMRDRVDSTELLPTLEVPTLVVAGREDQIITTENARALAAAIPRAHLSMISESGHMTPLEQPVAMSRVVREFLEAIG